MHIKYRCSNKYHYFIVIWGKPFQKKHAAKFINRTFPIINFIVSSFICLPHLVWAAEKWLHRWNFEYSYTITTKVVFICARKKSLLCTQTTRIRRALMLSIQIYRISLRKMRLKKWFNGKSYRFMPEKGVRAAIHWAEMVISMCSALFLTLTMRM